MSTAAPPKNFWDDPHRDPTSFDWDSYLTSRPTYTPDFYALILSYHRSHNGQSHLLHDIATGPGNVAFDLSPHFDRVVASDACEPFVQEAERRLRGRDDGGSGSGSGSGKFETQQFGAEELGERVEAGTVDMVTVAEAIPMIDHAVFVAGAGEVLRAGGTLAVWFYGRAFFVDEEVGGRCQGLLDECIEREFDRARPLKGSAYERPARTYHAFLDGVAFPAREWVGVERWKWNCDRPLEFLDHEKLDFEVPYVSAITGEEKVVEKMDREIFALDGDVEWVRGYVGSLLPGRETDKGRLEGMERLYKELGEAMGGVGVKRRIGWSVVLLLATKR